MVPRLCGIRVDHYLRLERGRIIHGAGMEEIQLRHFSGFLQHGAAAPAAKTAAHGIAAIRLLLVKIHITFDNGHLHRHGELGRVAGPGYPLALPALADKREFRFRGNRVFNRTAGTTPGNFFIHDFFHLAAY